MLLMNVIEPAQTRWASPSVLSIRKDGTIRLCVDYRKLSAITVRVSYPLARADECVNSLGNAQVYSKLDANSGSWQMTGDKVDRENANFTSNYGLYHFTRMPFGLNNAFATFQRVM